MFTRVSPPFSSDADGADELTLNDARGPYSLSYCIASHVKSSRDSRPSIIHELAKRDAHTPDCQSMCLLVYKVTLV